MAGTGTRMQLTGILREWIASSEKPSLPTLTLALKRQSLTFVFRRACAPNTFISCFINPSCKL